MKPITDLLSDLITEHGSAAILRERLEQVKAQALPLLDENKRLKTRVAELEEVIRRLTEELRTKAKSDNMPADAERILLRFFKDNGQFTDGQIAAMFKLHPSVAAHHMDVLRERHLIEGIDWVRVEGSGPERMEITAEGRAYVMEHGLHAYLDTV